MCVALLVLGAFFVGTGRPIHDRFEKLGLPECLPAAMDAPVVVDTDALDRGGVEDAPAVDEATLAIGRCVQSARDFYGDYQNVLLVGTAAVGPADARRHVLGGTPRRP